MIVSQSICRGCNKPLLPNQREYCTRCLVIDANSTDYPPGFTDADVQQIQAEECREAERLPLA